MLKVVIDVNLFVSAIINRKGNPYKLFQLWRSNVFLLIISERMLEEMKKVLQYPRIKKKYNLRDEQIKQAVDTVKKFAIAFPVLKTLDVIKEDPDDNEVLACALTAKVDFIVSGDNHLLELGAFEDIPIVTVKNFLDNIGYNLETLSHYPSTHPLS